MRDTQILKDKETLHLDGKLLIDNENIPEIVKRFKHEISQVQKIPVVLDLAGTSEIRSQVIYVAISLYKQCLDDNRSFWVEIADQRLWDLFTALKLDTKIEFKKLYNCKIV